MNLETLAKLTLFYEECKEKGIIIHSQEFMDDTKSVIDAGIKDVQEEREFFQRHPGPHVFAINENEIHIFSPEYTASPEWAIILSKHNEDTIYQTYTFNSVTSLLYSFIQIFQSFENGSTDSQKKQSN